MKQYIMQSEFSLFDPKFLEEVAKMASRCELINPQVKPAPQDLQDKHYFRKHGANAYYGQGNK